jgi:RluA family pseudouridine synthase
MAGVPVLHRDDELAVVDKPVGLLVVQAPGRSAPSLVDVLSAQFGQRVFAVHRLDEETSGCVVVALAEPTRRALDDMFRRHAVERDYLALLTAVPSPQSGRVESRLGEDAQGVVRVVSRGGRTAVTHYRTLTRRERCCLVHCRLETGRRNQIRVHMAALGCPVAGDRKYGYRKREGESFERVMLHSWRLRLTHPVSGAALAVSCEPEDALLRPESRG